MEKKKKSWMRFRHKIARNLVCVFLKPYAQLKYGIRVEPFREQGKRAYLILLNHQTAFDQFFVGISFRGPVYYLASEDIFSIGWVSSLIRWLVAPIPIKKQTMDISAVKNCIKVAREGGTIAIAPEGNRTYSGRTEYMNDSIAGLARKLNLPIALYRIEGGYGVHPRWSDVVRRGKMRSYVSRVIEPEEYADMTNEELFQQIQKGLYVDEGVADGIFASSKRAEYLERAIYVCPFCGLSEFESHGNEIECKKCGRKVMYGEDKCLSGVGFRFPYEFVSGWYDYQNRFVCSLDVMQYVQEPLYRDTASVYQVIVNSHKVPVYESVGIHLYGDRVVLNAGAEKELVLPFNEISAAAVLGKNKLNLYHGKQVYQIKGDKRFNALKYVNLYFRHKNILRGVENGQFLGL